MPKKRSSYSSKQTCKRKMKKKNHYQGSFQKTSEAQEKRKVEDPYGVWAMRRAPDHRMCEIYQHDFLLFF